MPMSTRRTPPTRAYCGGPCRCAAYRARKLAKAPTAAVAWGWHDTGTLPKEVPYPTTSEIRANRIRQPAEEPVHIVHIHEVRAYA